MNTEQLINEAERAEKVIWGAESLAQCANSGVEGIEVVIKHKRGKKRILFTQGGGRISRAKAESILGQL